MKQKQFNSFKLTQSRFFLTTLFCASFLLGFTSLSVLAGTSADFSDGSVIIGADATACSGALAGALRYNTTSDKIEFCNGSNWVVWGD